jgi:hypothetical protein
MVYLEPYTFIQLVCNSDTVNRKCRILRFKIIIFWVMGPGNLIGGY